MIDYDQIIKNVEGYSPQRISTRKKFKRISHDEAIKLYKVYRLSSRMSYNDDISRKFYNHLRSQGKQGTTNQKVHQHFNGNYVTRIKRSKGLFECWISYGGLDSARYSVEITRTTIKLRAKSGDYDLNDKSERFVASIEHDFDYDSFLVIQHLLKQKPSGTYYINTCL